MSNSLAIVVSLPSDFISLLNAEIDSELEIAQHKWKLTLTDEQAEHVRKSARDQLRSKVSGLAKANWDLGNKVVINAAGASGNLAINKKTKSDQNMMLVLSKAGWAVTQEETDSAIHVTNLYESLLKTLFTWSRTAVFYGVGSYTSR